MYRVLSEYSFISANAYQLPAPTRSFPRFSYLDLDCDPLSSARAIYVIINLESLTGVWWDHQLVNNQGK